jgi:hypothetical protein
MTPPPAQAVQDDDLIPKCPAGIDSRHVGDREIKVGVALQLNPGIATVYFQSLSGI